MKYIFSFPVLAGISIVKNKNSAISSVSNKGSITLRTSKINSPIIKHDFIFLRGIEFIIFATIYFLNTLKESLILANEKIVYNKQSLMHKNQFLITAFIVIICCLLCFVVVSILATHLGFVLFSNSYSLFVKNISIAITKIALLYLLFFALSFTTLFRSFNKFNASGNLIIYGKKHRPLNYFNILIFSLLMANFVISLLGLNLEFGWKIIVNLALLLLSFSLTFELALLLEKKGGKSFNFVAVISVLTTAVPSKTEFQVATCAYNEVELMQEINEREIIKEQSTENGVNFSIVYANVKNALKTAGINDVSEADWLIACVLKKKKLDIKLLHYVTKQQEKEINKALEKRIKGEPIDKIFGFTEFYGLNIKVNKNVLTPRQETEILVENAIKFIDNKKLQVLDLCTGSGAIAVAIAVNTNANITASDVSELALNVAKENAKKNDVKINFRQSDLFSRLKLKKYDLIVSNPPYIKSEDIEKLDKEVKNYDPKLALDGGTDGYDFYKRIIKECPRHLTKKGVIMFEIGKGQANKIKKLLTESFINIRIVKDYNNIQRIIIAERK